MHQRLSVTFGKQTPWKGASLTTFRGKENKFRSQRKQLHFDLEQNLLKVRRQQTKNPNQTHAAMSLRMAQFFHSYLCVCTSSSGKHELP